MSTRKTQAPAGGQPADTKVRDRIIQAMADLMENQGFHASGINAIVAESGAPKGSIYHYFPGGKDEIAAASVLEASRTVAASISDNLPTGPDIAADLCSYVRIIAHFLEASGFRSGGPLTIVAAETANTNEAVNAACRQAYTEMQAAFAERFVLSGFSLEGADSLAVTVTAAVEGGILLSRTAHSADPLRIVAGQLGSLVTSLQSGGKS